MKSTGSTLVTAAVAVALVVGVTVVQGTWTERWGRHFDYSALERAARLLEKCFPREFGDWEFEQAIESSPAELERAGAVGHVSWAFRNLKTKTPISAFVVCATPHDASGHTPDRCYPGAGFEIAEAEHRETITLANGRLAEAFTGTFRKGDQTLRVFWTYGVSSPDPALQLAAGQSQTSTAPVKAESKTAKAGDKAGGKENGEGKEDGKDREPAADAQNGSSSAPPLAEMKLRWIAPGIARIALNGEGAVYKLYAIVDQSKLSSAQAIGECSDFLAQALPVLDERIRVQEQATGAESPEAVPAAPAS